MGRWTLIADGRRQTPVVRQRHKPASTTTASPTTAVILNAAKDALFPKKGARNGYSTQAPELERRQLWPPGSRAGWQRRTFGVGREVCLCGMAPDPEPLTITLRTHRPGDLGWIVHRHGKLYAEEFGYNEKFEGVVAEIAADFLRTHDPARERCWLAELDGRTVGSIMLVQHRADVGKLRIMLVEPEARGRGVAKALVHECIRFAREAGYRKLTLWTHQNLVAARHIYAQAGFCLVHSEPAAEGFGQQLIDETWELEL